MINYTPRLYQAVNTAARAHDRHQRKGSDIPYIVHPFSVMTIAAEATEDEDVLIACLFHDILEDVPENYSEQTMRQEYGDRVTELVLGVTKNSDITDWRQRSEAYLEHLWQADDGAVIVSAADKIHNLISILEDLQNPWRGTLEHI